MTSFLIASQIIVFSHIAFGELAGASLLWGIKELLFFSRERLKWLRASLWIAFVSIFLAWGAGGTYYLFFYPKVKPVIKGGPEIWSHDIFTESKEHIFFFLPILIFILAFFAQKTGEVLGENRRIKNKYLLLMVLTTLFVFSMALMGYMITWGARTALWVKSGL